MRELNISTSGKKTDLQLRLHNYLNTSLRENHPSAVDQICNLSIGQMNQHFFNERDSIFILARVPDLRNSLPHSSTINSTNQSINPATEKSSSCSVLINGTQYSQSPNIPSVIYEQSPFYRLAEPATDPVMVTKPVAKNSNKALVTFFYTFSDQDGKLAKQGNLSLLLMAVNANEAKTNKTKPIHISFPPQAAMKINGNTYSESLRGLKGKPGTTRPADLTKYTTKTGKNTIEVLIPEVSQPYLLRLYLALPSSIEDIVNDVKARPSIKKDDTANQIQTRLVDDEIEELSIIATIKCPVAGSRIQIPARSINCNHFECFDLMSFILLQQQATTWRCPICNETITYENLAVDDYMVDVLEKVKIYDIDDVEILPDGTWRKAADAPLLGDNDDDSDTPDERHSENNAKSSFLPDDAVVILLDSDEEDNVQEQPPSVTLSSPVANIQTSNSLHSSTPLAENESGTNTNFNATEPPKITAPPTKDYSREELFEQMPAWTSSLFGNRRARRPKTTEPATPLNNNDAEPFKLPTDHQLQSVETVTDTVFQHAPAQEPSIQPNGGILKKSRKSMDEGLIRSLIPFNTHTSSVFKPRNLRSQSSSLNKTISGNPSNINSISDINRYLSESKSVNSAPLSSSRGIQESVSAPSKPELTVSLPTQVSPSSHHRKHSLSSSARVFNKQNSRSNHHSANNARHRLKRSAAVLNDENNIIDLTLSDDDDDDIVVINSSH